MLKIIPFLEIDDRKKFFNKIEEYYSFNNDEFKNIIKKLAWKYLYKLCKFK